MRRRGSRWIRLGEGVFALISFVMCRFLPFPPSAADRFASLSLVLGIAVGWIAQVVVAIGLRQWMLQPLDGTRDTPRP